jgi:hypothetical protein
MERARSECLERWRAELTPAVACQSAPQMFYIGRLFGGEQGAKRREGKRKAPTLFPYISLSLSSVDWYG